MRKLMPLLGGISLGLGIGIVIFFGFLQEDTTNNLGDSNLESDPIPIPSQDVPAPNFKLENIIGESIQLEDFHGKPVILNFWATWCAPCRLEMPLFQRYHEIYAGNIVILAINNAEDPEVVQEFVDEFALTFDILLDPNSEAQRSYQVLGYPTTIFIDPDGVMRRRHIGLLEEEQLDDYLQGLYYEKD